MPFIPHTAEEERTMLAEIGVDSIEALFDEIPDAMRAGVLNHVPPGVSEMDMLRDMAARAARDDAGVCFVGAGSYDHHVPAAVWDLTSRGEFMTAYTPYQAEASQGTLQLIYEFQTMMANLTALDVSNASVYDGASGLAEAVLMAVRGNRKAKSRTVLMAGTVHPHYQEATRNIVGTQGVDTTTVPVTADGRIDRAALEAHDHAVALVLQQPNFFGLLEDVDALTDWAHERGALVIAVVNPLALAVLKPPGEWGADGADIACGDGQPFGIPMSSGGPSFGYICCRSGLVRQMPGRIIGRTVDLEGRPGYALTLQAREQHIRRGKATSNICTNQGLLVTAATIHMSLLGADGIDAVARASAANTRALVSRLTAIDGVSQRFGDDYFHEAALDLPRPAEEVVQALLEHGLLGGLPLGGYYPDMDRTLLVCATEKRTEAEIEHYARALEEVLGA
ncbi:MAG: aminomethyl-transferring glycine dehydrogenase [Gammaproteobacteria bacterium]|nr:aminomethyl-transferring glycine dehydrogenase [Gammaproteobacteria bacterium]|tara:strand:- start:709 stop:2061 length:1353 start_codon:yes stop_codon:yes gene_type:complete